MRETGIKLLESPIIITCFKICTSGERGALESCGERKSRRTGGEEEERRVSGREEGEDGQGGGQQSKSGTGERGRDCWRRKG